MTSARCVAQESERRWAQSAHCDMTHIDNKYASAKGQYRRPLQMDDAFCPKLKYLFLNFPIKGRLGCAGECAVNARASEKSPGGGGQSGHKKNARNGLKLILNV